MSLDTYHGHCCTFAPLGRRFTTHAAANGIVQDAGEMEAAAHICDRHVVRIDHADPFGARARLADHAQAAQSMQSSSAPRRTGHVDSLLSEHVHGAGARLRHRHAKRNSKYHAPCSCGEGTCVGDGRICDARTASGPSILWSREKSRPCRLAECSLAALIDCVPFTVRSRSRARVKLKRPLARSTRARATRTRVTAGCTATTAWRYGSRCAPCRFVAWCTRRS